MMRLDVYRRRMTPPCCKVGTYGLARKHALIAMTPNYKMGVENASIDKLGLNKKFNQTTSALIVNKVVNPKYSIWPSRHSYSQKVLRADRLSRYKKAKLLQKKLNENYNTKTTLFLKSEPKASMADSAVFNINPLEQILGSDNVKQISSRKLLDIINTSTANTSPVPLTNINKVVKAKQISWLSKHRNSQQALRPGYRPRPKHTNRNQKKLSNKKVQLNKHIDKEANATNTQMASPKEMETPKSVKNTETLPNPLLAKESKKLYSVTEVFEYMEPKLAELLPEPRFGQRFEFDTSMLYQQLTWPRTISVLVSWLHISVIIAFLSVLFSIRLGYVPRPTRRLEPKFYDNWYFASCFDVFFDLF